MTIKVDKGLVCHLIADQIPQWKNLKVRPVAVGGWDNRTFHLGEKMLVRMPSAAQYAMQVEKEFRWLPILAPLLPLLIPIPLVLGEAGSCYAWRWGIYRWLSGETVATTSNLDLNKLAKDLAKFLSELHHIDTTNGPIPGQHNFYRAGSLRMYDRETMSALTILKDTIDSAAALEVWQQALASTWHCDPVWVHGDISAGNLLTLGGKLSAVIDFGQLAVGDPACDLIIAWTLFQGKSRAIFKETLSLDAATWQRARGWALWKSLIIAAGISQTIAIEGTHCWRIIKEVLAE